ncbi:50S ribosomal protein L30 [Marinilactibacillus psychrotolerans]|uniref:Large ribosomal subunit protein uL30 n=2 Tax=Marinilactibacillus psychrotolerans TaxID=191770 RepID=A0A511H2F2_9LACT|nr:50S ribosomal protein L30 [Marinilactibacillus psychrotolerans]TLQ07908.1 50S ribosomal protein L30 [Marinilactibacillus psychrotolerans]SDC43963.1 large subunit ribosomal protein L30 [Marinilactibacillus psychrotolerans]SJN33338.1 LSU ribosomal protein L30p (L7e) [Marinilactibacillus psychrotolerans 42ea]GEL66939.1 50S ribosomal protein L30 [Marinilactibacillus psychrotolerans]GEQ33011.1 50S ribosomal protein L30 [Marinilactibacillus psychrotolerans]
MANLEITLKRSLIGRPQNQHLVVKSLGLKKTNSSVVRPDNDAVRGAIKKIAHLIDVKEV